MEERALLFGQLHGLNVTFVPLLALRTSGTEQGSSWRQAALRGVCVCVSLHSVQRGCITESLMLSEKLCVGVRTERDTSTSIMP